MKFILLVIAVLVLLWLLRRSLRSDRQAPPPPRPDVGAPQAMLSCAHCGIHVPRDEALPGRGGVFCDEQHRAAFERAHPNP